MRWLISAIGILGLSLSLRAATVPDSAQLLNSWFSAQAKVTTWKAEFVQTRKMKTLKQPLTSSGHVWFAAPDKFRWQLEPDKTIAVKGTNALLIIYPQLKRVERLSLTEPGPWRDSIGLLEAGFPQSQAQLERQFEIVSQDLKTNRFLEVSLRPRSAAARKLMPKMMIQFDIGNMSLTGTELTFADGSTMRNDFKNQENNPVIDSSLFNPPIPADFKVEEPLKRR